MGFLEKMRKLIESKMQTAEDAAKEGYFPLAQGHFEDARKLQAEILQLADQQQQAMEQIGGTYGAILGKPPQRTTGPDSLLTQAVREIMDTTTPVSCPNCELSIYPQDTNDDCRSDPGCHVTARLVADYVRKKLNPQQQGADYGEMAATYAYAQIIRTPFGFTGRGLRGTSKR